MSDGNVIKSVLLEELGFNNSSRSVDAVIRVYEKRYGGRVSNWDKLGQDIRTILGSGHANRKFLSRVIIRTAIDNGLNYIYVSDEPYCKEFRKVLFNTRKNDFMRRVRQVFN